MKTKTLLTLALTLSLQPSAFLWAAPLGTAFTYQGRLNDGSNPAQGIYDLRFAIYDATDGGAQIGSAVTNSPVTISNGLFTVTLDFGAGVFTGQARWLAIGVRSNGVTADFTPLAPRQPLSPTPYALYAPSAGTAASASSAVAGSISNAAIAVGAVDTSRIADGSIVAADLSPSLLTGTFWGLGGNAGTTAGAQFVGTTDGQPLEFKVNAQRALRLEPGVESPNVVAGYLGNAVGLGIEGAVIGGGGNVIGQNVVMSWFGTIGGGVANVISTNAGDTTIGGGWLNVISPLSGYATIGGGSHNTAGAISATVAGGYANAALAQDSVVAGGYSNSVASPSGAVVGGFLNRVEAGYAGGFVGGGRGNQVAAHNSSVVGGYENTITNLVDGFIGGGLRNQISANHTVIGGGLYNTNAGPGATIGGGNNNRIGALASDAFIGGGVFNRVEGFRSAITGGDGNTIQTNADYASIAGGNRNAIGTNADFSVIGGGEWNSVTTNHGTIAGGYLNSVKDTYAFVGGGYGNSATGTLATVVGGESNTAGGAAATVSGGRLNTASGYRGAIGGGYSNMASNNYATVAGGYDNVAGGYGASVPGGELNAALGDYSFAAGRRAKANHDGAFVWGDSNNADIASTNTNSVTMRASGGYRFFSSTDTTAPAPGVYLAPGGSSWTTISDRAAKKDCVPVDTVALLDRLAKVPVLQWHYQWEEASATPHFGPMAQDFKAAFYPGRDDKSISTMEFDGVALAAIQGLNQKVESGKQKAETRMGKLERTLEQKETEITELKRRLELLEIFLAQQNGGGQ